MKRSRSKTISDSGLSVEAASIEQGAGIFEEGATIGDAGQRIDARRRLLLHLALLLDHRHGEDGGADDEGQGFEVDQPEPAVEGRGIAGAKPAGRGQQRADAEEGTVQDKQHDQRPAGLETAIAAPEFGRGGQQVDRDDRRD